MSECPWRQKVPTTNCWVQPLPREGSDPGADEQDRWPFQPSVTATEVPLSPRRGMNRSITVEITNFSSCICLIGTWSRTWLWREPGGEKEIIRVWIANILKLHSPLDKSSQELQYLCFAVPGQSPPPGWEISSTAGEYLIGPYKRST